MTNKKRNYTIKFLLVLVTIFFISIPLMLGDLKSDFNTVLYDPNPKISDFSKDDFNAILTEEKHGLGNISIYDIDFSNFIKNQEGRGFITYNETYPLIGEDIFSEDLNITQLNLQFVATIDPAIVDNLNENITDSNSITVKLNESLFVEYNDLTEGYLIYLPRLVPCDLLQFWVNNGTNIFELIDETDYTVDKDNFIVFSYESYFNISVTTNFTMYLIWEYTLELIDWSLSQIIGDDLIIEDEEEDFTTDFNYYFILTGKKYNESILPIFADNIDIALTINHPDKDLFNNHILELNNETVDIAGHLNPDDTIDVSLADQFSGELSEFSLNFTIQFTFKFIEPVGETWAIDRLVEMNNIRQRIYFASIINGPQHIYFKYLSFYEPTIYVDQILSNTSLFERDFAYFFLNTTLTGRYGIKVSVPYLIVGEACPFIIKYKPTQTLRVVVLDNIKMPLVGADVKVYYFNQEYGTYISKDKVQPISPGKTDENGEIVLLHVPAGDYTIKVYYDGLFLKESTCSTYNYRNYIKTNYPHFPIWIIIFGIINGIILIFGLIFYSKYKKMR